jgi:hypothetical protein
MRHRPVLCAALVLFLSACHLIPGSDEQKIAEARDQVSEGLVEPESAKFRNMTFNRVSNAVCGEVNARNRMGGFTGFTRFFVIPGQVTLEPEVPNIDGPAGEHAFSAKFEDFCASPSQ